MHFVSTRDASVVAGLSGAVRFGLAPDGGLFIPAEWPRLAGLAQRGGQPTAEEPLATVALRVIAPFVAGDSLEAHLAAMTHQAFSFPAPLEALTDDGRLQVLELFHGPTAAFKDFGARFLAACLERLFLPGEAPVEILVATSGDTGGAVAAAFHHLRGVRVTLLYPLGLVSPTQERQLTCWDDNVVSCAVRGTFDDCQALVKAAFVDPELRKAFPLSSANSINVGRLLPQVAYYASASLATFARHGEPLSFIIPSGNLGNAFACVMAREVGLPIADIVLAHNANRPVVDYLASGEWKPRPSVHTVASAMDVGNPSNMERFHALFPAVEQFRAAVSAMSIGDEDIRRRIHLDAERLGRVWCPHTATAAEAWARLPASRRESGRWCIVATAHPAKFPETVEPLVGRAVGVPESLRALFSRPTSVRVVDASLPALRRVLAQ